MLVIFVGIERSSRLRVWDKSLQSRKKFKRLAPWNPRVGNGYPVTKLDKTAINIGYGSTFCISFCVKHVIVRTECIRISYRGYRIIYAYKTLCEIYFYHGFWMRRLGIFFKHLFALLKRAFDHLQLFVAYNGVENKVCVLNYRPLKTLLTMSELDDLSSSFKMSMSVVSEVTLKYTFSSLRLTSL